MPDPNHRPEWPPARARRVVRVVEPDEAIALIEAGVAAGEPLRAADGATFLAAFADHILLSAGTGGGKSFLADLDGAA